MHFFAKITVFWNITPFSLVVVKVSEEPATSIDYEGRTNIIYYKYY
jgi:hypothetical protein